MHQIVRRLRLRPRAHWGAYSAPPDPLAVCRGLIIKGGESMGEGEEMRKEKGREFVLCPRKKRKKVGAERISWCDAGRAAIDRCCRPSAANPSHRQWDRQTDGRTPDRYIGPHSMQAVLD